MLPLFGASRKQYGFVHCLLLRLPSEGGDYSVPACDDIIGSCPGKQKSLQGDKETSPTYDVTEKTVVEIKKERGGGEKIRINICILGITITFVLPFLSKRCLKLCLAWNRKDFACVCVRTDGFIIIIKKIH